MALMSAFVPASMRVHFHGRFAALARGAAEAVGAAAAGGVAGLALGRLRRHAREAHPTAHGEEAAHGCMMPAAALPARREATGSALAYRVSRCATRRWAANLARRVIHLRVPRGVWQRHDRCGEAPRRAVSGRRGAPRAGVRRGPRRRNSWRRAACAACLPGGGRDAARPGPSARRREFLALRQPSRSRRP